MQSVEELLSEGVRVELPDAAGRQFGRGPLLPGLMPGIEVSSKSNPGEVELLALRVIFDLLQAQGRSRVLDV